MLVLVMYIGHMRMGVRERLVPVEMGGRLACWVVRQMRMLVMFVVRVEVVVRDGGVSVLVLVMFAQVQPNAERHERGGDPETQVGASARRRNESAAPTKGAVEK